METFSGLKANTSFNYKIVEKDGKQHAQLINPKGEIVGEKIVEKKKVESITKHLPQTFTNIVTYQLTIRAFGKEWTACYEWGLDRFADITAHGETLEDAIKEMIYIFDNHKAFENIRGK